MLRKEKPLKKKKKKKRTNLQIDRVCTRYEKEIGTLCV